MAIVAQSMSRTPRQTPVQPVVRALPWSTRAVILLAFAIQLGSIGERAGQGAARPSDCLRMCDGQLLTIWLDDAPYRAAAGAVSSVWSVTVVGAEAHTPARASTLPARSPLAQVSSAILPMPPPASC